MENFELLDSETVYQGRIFSLDIVSARLPDGAVRKFDLVRHTGAVTIVPVDEQGRILFVRQYRLGADQALLELPAGMLNPNEDPLTCAAREIQEEIGQAAREMRALGSFFMAPGYSTEYMYVYLATGLYDSQLAHDEDEFLQVEAIPLAEVMEMTRRGALQDGKSLAALLLALPHLKP